MFDNLKPGADNLTLLRSELLGFFLVFCLDFPFLQAFDDKADESTAM